MTLVTFIKTFLLQLAITALTAVTRHGAVLDDSCVNKLKSSLPFVSWNPFPVDVWRGDDSFRIPRLHQAKRSCLTACSNSNRFVPLTRSWTQKTRKLLNAGAFLHWFEKHGCERDQILCAVTGVEDLMRNYVDL